MTTSAIDVQQLAINSIRTLSMDAVQQANSGHPGTPMALAPVTYALWNNHLNYDPANPNWFCRDRFVLSCGHASMLLYSILHLASVKENGKAAISIEDIKDFRQLHKPCAGHPEYGEAPGIETTTGPLGQGIATSIGMAAASKWLGARYSKDLCDYNVYVLCSDGDLMEGVGCEAASMAGHLKLENLCWVYDDNHITIEGHTDLAYSEDVAKKYEAMGWHTVTVTDANDLDAINAAFEKFKSTTGKPTLIILKSIIGFGAPNKQDTASAHGSPLGEDEITAAKESYGWTGEKFSVPADVIQHFQDGLGKRGAAAFKEWETAWAAYSKDSADEAKNLDAIMQRKLPDGWDASLPHFEPDAKGMATRASSGKVLNAVAGPIEWLIGGSADLAGSTKTIINDDSAGHFSADNFAGRNFHYGIREHAMAAMCNGMSLSGIRAYGATFFVFTDYLRPAMRLSGLMHQPVLYVLTHDSIGLGEDGPTHQPVEHLAACRAIPNVLVVRPADANEVSQSYFVAMSETKRPTALVLTRQNLPTLDRSNLGSAEGVRKGAYILQDCDGTPDVILIGTGSEVEICMEAAQSLAGKGTKARVVSMPCWELFDEQPQAYRDEVLPPAVTARVAVEAGIKQGWEKYIGTTGEFVGMTGFGASAPADQLYKHFGITAAAVEEAAASSMKAAV